MSITTTVNKRIIALTHLFTSEMKEFLSHNIIQPVRVLYESLLFSLENNLFNQMNPFIFVMLIGKNHFLIYGSFKN